MPCAGQHHILEHLPGSGGVDDVHVLADQEGDRDDLASQFAECTAADGGGGDAGGRSPDEHAALHGCLLRELQSAIARRRGLGPWLHH
jgi:hypothetical protein